MFDSLVPNHRRWFSRIYHGEADFPTSRQVGILSFRPHQISSWYTHMYSLYIYIYITIVIYYYIFDMILYDIILYDIILYFIILYFFTWSHIYIYIYIHTYMLISYVDVIFHLAFWSSSSFFPPREASWLRPGGGPRRCAAAPHSLAGVAGGNPRCGVSSMAGKSHKKMVV